VKARLACSILLLVATIGGPAGAQVGQPPEPRVGQPGKDAVWVPTPPELIEKMLDLARVTPRDYVIDLGSGDGRMVIAAARRGARARGVEYNEDLVALSRLRAAEAGVADRAEFVQGDMYEADISRATVMALYLLPENLNRLLPKFQALPPGSRIVSNTFGFEGWERWEPDERSSLDAGSCADWCEALLWIVPAQVAGQWAMEGDTLHLQQTHQVVTGTLNRGENALPITAPHLRGAALTFTAGDAVYAGEVKGDVINGTATRSGRPPAPWRATRSTR
jgi:SAM-dependent methyltransferase